MLVKLTSDNQLTLPEEVAGGLEGAEYLEVAVEAGRVVLTPVHVVHAATVRAKLAEMGIAKDDVGDAPRLDAPPGGEHVGSTRPG